MKPILHLFALIFLISPLSGQEHYPQNFATEGGYLSNIVQSNDTLFVAGTFYIGGYKTGSFIGYSETDRNSIDADLPFIDIGELRDIISDGNGGWYVAIGGGISYQGDPYRGVLHFNADMSLDDDFSLTQPGSSFAGTINALKLHNNKLYVGGSFDQYNGSARTYLLSFDIPTNSIDQAFNAGFVSVPQNQVKKIEVYQNQLLVGGDFTTGSGQPASYFGAFDINTGELIYDFNANADVKQIAIDADTLYAGGSFSVFQGISKFGMIKMNLADYSLLPFNAAFDGFVGRVFDFKLSESDIYIGGYFSTINGSNYPGLVKMNRYDQEIDTDFNVTFDNARVESFDLQGDQLVLGGTFNQVNGAVREKLAQVNRFTGELSTWDSSVAGTPVFVKTYNNRLIVFGNMDQMNRQIRHSFSALKMPERKLLPINFTSSDFGLTIRDMVKEGNKLYFAASGNQINGVTIGKLFSYNLQTQEIVNIGDFGGIPNATVDRLLIHDGKLYINGYFLEVNGLSRPRLARINLSDNSLDDWNPQLGGNTGARSMKVLNDKLFIAGNINIGNDQYAACAVNLSDAAWAGGLLSEPTPEEYYTGTDLYIDGNTLYLSGNQRLSFSPFIQSAVLKLNEQFEIDTNFIAEQLENSTGAESLGMINGVLFAMHRIDSDLRKIYFHSPINGDSLLSLDIIFSGSAPFVGPVNKPTSFVFSDDFLLIGGNWDRVNGNAVRGLAIIDGRSVPFPNLISSNGKQHNNDANQWIAFPNPNHGQFQIRLNSPLSKKSQIEIFDFFGRQIHSNIIPAGAHNVDFDLSNLESGIYLIRFNNQLSKIVVQTPR